MNKIGVFLSNGYLEDAYTNRKLAMGKIAKEVGCSPATVLKYLQRLNIPIRTSSEAQKGKKLAPWLIEVIRNRETGKVLSIETKRKISESHKRGHYRSPHWNGGKRTGRSDKYIQIYKPDHPFSSKEGYVMEHRLVMEQKIGRYLTKEEIVHHVNKTRTDNHPDNLRIMSPREHATLHLNERWGKLLIK